MLIERVFGIVVLLLFAMSVVSVGSHDALAKDINVYPANADSKAVEKVQMGADGKTGGDDDVTCGLTGNLKSPLACDVQGLVGLAEPGDRVIFNPADSGENPNVYDDVGEILITTNGDDSDTDDVTEMIMILGKGSGDDMITFTGKVMFNVKASNILVRGFTFKDTEIPDSVTMRVAVTSGTPADAIKYGFPGITLRDYLAAEEAGSPAWKSTDPFSLTNVDTNGGFLWDGNAGRDIWASWLNEPYVTVAGPDDDDVDKKAIANLADGTEVGADGSGNKQIEGASFPSGILVATALNVMGTIWVDSVVAGTACPTGGLAVTNVQIRNNVFDNTYLTGVRAGDHSHPSRFYIRQNGSCCSDTVQLRAATTKECGAQLEVVGNEFTNVGGNGPFLKDSAGNDFMDGGENKIAGFGNREAAVSFLNVGSTGTGDNAVSSKITDNTIVGGTYDAIAVAGTPKDAKVEISYNDIKNSILNGIDIAARTDGNDAATADITVEGNRIWGSSGNRFLNKPFQPVHAFNDGYAARVGSNNGEYDKPTLPGDGRAYFGQNSPGGDITTSCDAVIAAGSGDGARIEALTIRAMSPEVWKTGLPSFPFPDTGAPKSILSSESSPANRDAAVPFRKLTSSTPTTTSIMAHDLVRYKADECYNLGRIRVNGQGGVTIKNNDLGYVEDRSDASVSLALSPKNGVVVMRAGTPTGVPLKAFTGNNIDFYREYAVLNTGTSFSAAMNYLGPGARAQGVSGADIGGDPIAGDDRQIGPRAENRMPPDEEAPVLMRTGDNAPAVSGTSLTLTFDGPLGTSTPVPGAFTVAVGTSSEIEVTRVSISGSTVTLTLGAAVRAGETVTVAYTRPSSGNVIMDAAGNALESFTATAVTNNSTGGTGTPTPPPSTGSPATSSDDGGCSLASAGSGTDLGALVLLLGAVSFVFGLGRRKAKAE